MRVRLKKSGRGSSSSGSSATNRSADVSNIICLTVCVFGLKKKGGATRKGLIESSGGPVGNLGCPGIIGSLLRLPEGQLCETPMLEPLLLNANEGSGGVFFKRPQRQKRSRSSSLQSATEVCKTMDFAWLLVGIALEVIALHS